MFSFHWAATVVQSGGHSIADWKLRFAPRKPRVPKRRVHNYAIRIGNGIALVRLQCAHAAVIRLGDPLGLNFPLDIALLAPE